MKRGKGKANKLGWVRIINVLLWSAFTLALLVAGSLIGAYFYLARDLPALYSLRNYQPWIITKVFADDGALIAEFYDERRKIMPLEEIPRETRMAFSSRVAWQPGSDIQSEKGIPWYVQLAFIAAEDRRFLSHSGVDWYRVLGALYANLRSLDIEEGASTITMQLAKTFFLEHETTASYKLRQTILALRIERYLTKPEILYLYLNQVDLGRRNFGVGAAAEYYFGKSASELDLAEAAMLAGILPAPSVYNPVSSFKHAKYRQKIVLGAMVDEGIIKKERAVETYQQPLRITREGGPAGKAAPHFTEHVRRVLVERYGRDAVYRDGLRVFTTVNLEADRVAADVIKDGVRGPHGLDKVLGFRGPLSEEPLFGDTMEQFLQKQEQEHREEWREQRWDRVLEEGRAGESPRSEVEKEAPAPVPLKQGELYKAVVESVNDRAKEVRARIGHNRGRIAYENMDWACPYDREAEPPLELEKPSDILERGDLILVKVLESKETGEGGVHYEFSLEQKPEIQAGLFSMSTRTGHVKALCGGVASHFIRPLQAKRQPGSAFKPVIYGAAINSGKYTPASIIIDSPIIFDQDSKNPRCPEEVTLWDRYAPKNYSDTFTGPHTVRSAISNSINTIAVKVSWNLCLPNVISFARKLGIDSHLDKLPCLALGCSEVTLSELVTAYNVYATGGYLVEPVYITRVYDRRGNLLEYDESVEQVRSSGGRGSLPGGMSEEDITSGKGQGARAMKSRHVYLSRPTAPQLIDQPTWKEYLKEISSPDREWLAPATTKPRGTRTVDAQTAFIVNSLLKSVVKEGTATLAKRLNRPVAGKTGTTNNYRDAWFVGYTPELITGVWAGGDQYYYPLGEGMSGGVAALPLWYRFMKQAVEDRPPVGFPVPKGIEWVRIDKKTGLLASQYTGPRDVIVECFIKGTEPEKYSPPDTQSVLDENDILRKLGDRVSRRNNRQDN